MIEQAFRDRYQRIFVNPLVHRLKYSITPLSITYLSGIFGLLFVPFFLLNKQLIAIICLLISGYLDTLDGSLARFQKTSTDFGSAMDIIMDRIVEFTVIFAFFCSNPTQNGLPVIVMLGSILLCITSFLVVGIFTNNTSEKSFHYSPGLMERAEAFAFFIAMTLYPGYFKFLAAFFSILVCITALIRMREFKNNCNL